MAISTISVAQAVTYSGAVLQVVQGSTTTQVSSSVANSWVDTTLSASITPKSATSKILVIVNQNYQVTSNNADAQGNVQILRNGTSILGSFGYDQIRFYAPTGGSGEAMGATLPMTYLDSPASTSSLTYKTQFSLRSGTMMLCQIVPQFSYITLMEIAG